VVSEPIATRLLALAGEEGAADRSAVRAKLDSVRRFLLLYAATRSWLWLAVDRELDAGALVASAVALTACAALSVVPRFVAWAPRLALPVLFVQLWLTLPITNNHFFLELVCTALVALPGGDEPEAERWALAGLVWVAALVLFHSGLGKVLYGLYFQGELLSFLIGQGGRFADAFRWVVPADEVARLASYHAMQAGAGPYRAASVPLVVLSNLVWIAEIVLAPLLVWRRTRAVAAVGALLMILAIQVGAREIGFALLYGYVLLACLPGAAVRFALPVVAALCAWALLAAAGFLPGVAWLETANL
jgi:hypothetical protein